MRMKKTNRLYRCLLPLVWLTFLLSSCIKEDYAGSTDETATVNLVFSTRADGQGTADVDENEGIKTLRVLITDADGKVEINTVQNFNDVPKTTLTILGVPVGTKNFYVIANEASVGLTDLDDVSTVDEDFLNRVITNPSDAPYFPKTRSQISTSGLPITGMKEGVQVKGGENQRIEIEIVHTVAKVVLYVDNQSGEPFTLQQVKFGPFIADRTYLFDKSQQLPVGVNFNDMPLNAENVEVTPDKDEAVFTGYIYETGSQDISDFTLSLVSDTNGFEALATPVTIQFNETERNYINRNDQVEIRAIVNIHKEVETDLDILVVPWGEKDIDVPPFS